jgi:O-antigen biosynthesis protein
METDPARPWRIPEAMPPREDLYTVTAIVSTYCSEIFMRGCLEDLTQQTLFKAGKVEILVIDSGSPENEGASVEEFQKRHQNIFYTRTEREPLYAAWNRAIRMARGRYLTNANTDDRHRVDALEIMARTLDQHPDVALVYGDMAMTSTANETFASARNPHIYRFFDYDPMEMLGEGRCGPQPMWRKKLHAELGGFCEEFKVASDYEWWLRISEKYPLRRIPETLGLYLKRPDSIENRQLQICEAETELIQRYYRARQPLFDEKRISRKPKHALPRFFWKLKRSVKKRLSGN